jgi:hypothetical protein
VNAPAPKNLSELRSYLGLLNYYHKFLKNSSIVLSPLYQLLQHQVSWHWGKREEEAFKKSKEMLQNSQLLVHYNPNMPLVLTCDSSSYGIGCVLSHIMPSKDEKPIAFASRTLSKAERAYSMSEKEGLAIVFGILKFHRYIYGRHFTIVTDHKPLLGLLKEDKAISATASARIQRWALLLENYSYTLTYRQGGLIGNADCLSRLPVTSDNDQVSQMSQEAVLSLSTMNITPVTSDRIALWTTKDPILSKVLDFVKNGWPETNSSSEMMAYWRRKDELTVESNCLLWGSRVVIPYPGRQQLLAELHDSHSGMVKMKYLARSYFWWPNLDSDIEQLVRNCRDCQEVRSMPPRASLHPWEWPTKPWLRLHIDFAGPVDGKMLMIIIDAHSKFIEVFPMRTITASATILKLRQLFATHGLPVILVSDNGPTFSSQDFAEFCNNNGIKHVKSSPYHPSSNGQVERAVQIVKSALKKMSGDLETNLYRFLMTYRLTPQSTTGHSPAELLMGRRPRNLLDLVKPSVENRVIKQQDLAKIRHDAHSRDRSVKIGNHVLARNFFGTPKWLRGIITEQRRPVTFMVLLEDGRLWKRHQDHLLLRHGVNSCFEHGEEESRNNSKVKHSHLPENQDLNYRPSAITKASSDVEFSEKHSQLVIPPKLCIQDDSHFTEITEVASDTIHSSSTNSVGDEAPTNSTSDEFPANSTTDEVVAVSNSTDVSACVKAPIPLRRSMRIKKCPSYLQDYKLSR